MQFEFATTTRIIFGPGKINSIASLVHEFGNYVFIIWNGPKKISDHLINLLQDGGIECTPINVEHEPSVDSVRSIVNLAKQSGANLIIGIGGGSAIDSAKATAAIITNHGDITDYLEVIGQNKPLQNPSLPMIAIPTTAGTGSEVTKNAVLGSKEHHVKVSLRSLFLLPKIAVIDPELTLSVPKHITAFTGLDTLTQLIEPFTCNIPNPLTDAICIEGLRRVSDSLYQAYETGDNLQPRENMAIASLFSGLALANAKLGAVHGLAGPIGGIIDAPHSAICAALLPNVMEINIYALRERSPDNPALKRYQIIGEILTGEPNADATSVLDWTRYFCQHTQIPPLSTYGIKEGEFDEIIEKSMMSSSMKGNPITLLKPELRNILQRSL